MLEFIIKVLVTVVAVTHAHYPLVLRLVLPVSIAGLIMLNVGDWKVRALVAAQTKNMSYLQLSVVRI